MSEENVEIVRRAFETLEREDGEAMLRYFDSQIVWEVRPDLPDADTYRGHDGVRKLLRVFDDVLDESWYSPQELIDAGDLVVVVLRWGGRGKGSSIDVQEEEAWNMIVRGGQIVRVTEYPSRERALEAAGLQK